MIQFKTLDHSVDIIGPELRVGVGMVRLVGETMTSQIHGYQSMRIGQTRIHLKIPGEPRLGSAVEKQDRPTAMASRFHDVELSVPATCDFMSFHVNPPADKTTDRRIAIVPWHNKCTKLYS
jgi:hypothetical protein